MRGPLNRVPLKIPKGAALPPQAEHRHSGSGWGSARASIPARPSSLGLSLFGEILLLLSL